MDGRQPFQARAPLPIGRARRLVPRPTLSAIVRARGEPVGIVTMGIVEKRQANAPSAAADFDRFRLCRFVESLPPDELETVTEPVDLADVAAVLEGNPNAVLFRAVGPERQELVGNVTGSRTRLARAFGVAPNELLAEVPAPPAQQAGHRRGVARGGAGAGGRAHRRRRRPHQASRASRARRRRRPLYLRRRSTSWSIRKPAGPMWACAG